MPVDLLLHECPSPARLIIIPSTMVRDGYYYGLAFAAIALLLGWLTIPALAIVPLLLAGFSSGSFAIPSAKFRP